MQFYGKLSTPEFPGVLSFSSVYCMEEIFILASRDELSEILLAAQSRSTGRINASGDVEEPAMVFPVTVTPALSER